MCDITGNISSGCLLFPPLFWPRETDRKIVPSKLNKPKKPHKTNRRVRGRIKQKCWDITSFNLCSSVFAQQHSLSPYWEREVRGDHGRAMQRGLLAAPWCDPSLQTWKVCLVCWEQESSFQTRSVILTLEGSRNVVVSALSPPKSLQSYIDLSPTCACFCSWDIPSSKCHKSFKASGDAHPEFRKFSFHQTPSNVSCVDLGAGTSCAFWSGTDHGSFLLCLIQFPTSHLYFKCFTADPKRNKPKIPATPEAVPGEQDLLMANSCTH